MFQRTYLLALSLVAAQAVSAQQQPTLSLGLNTDYQTPRGVGLGASLLYRKPLGKHFEWSGQLGGQMYPGISREERYRTPGTLPSAAFASFGLAYTTGLDGKGLRIALEPGVVTTNLFVPGGHQVLPSATFSIGVRLSDRVSLSLVSLLAPLPHVAQQSATVGGLGSLRLGIDLGRKRDPK